jgi:hypothetical protein
VSQNTAIDRGLPGLIERRQHAVLRRYASGADGGDTRAPGDPPVSGPSPGPIPERAPRRRL